MRRTSRITSQPASHWNGTSKSTTSTTRVPLLVDEVLGRLPARYFRLPSQRDAVQAQAIVDAHARPQDDRRREDLEVQPRRRQRFQVGGIGKELKDLVARAGQPDLGREAHQPL